VVATLTAAGVVAGAVDPSVTPAERTLYVAAEDRTMFVGREQRTVFVGAEDRTAYTFPDLRTVNIARKPRVVFV